MKARATKRTFPIFHKEPNMDLHQIILELGRIQQIRKAFGRTFQVPIRPGRILCPRCKKLTCSALEFQIPEFTPDIFNPETPTCALDCIQMSTRILDGYCGRCGYDWWARMCELDPDSGRDAHLGRFPPRFRNNQTCPFCRQAHLLGFFRMGSCTGGMCTFCRHIIAPESVKKIYTARIRTFGSSMRYKETALRQTVRTLIGPTIQFNDKPLVETDDLLLWKD